MVRTPLPAREVCLQPGGHGVDVNRGHAAPNTEKSIAPDKVTLYAARADPALLQIARGAGGEAFRHTHGSEDKFVVWDTGNMGVKQGLDVILSAARLSQG